MSLDHLSQNIHFIAVAANYELHVFELFQNLRDHANEQIDTFPVLETTNVDNLDRFIIADGLKS